MANPQNVLIVDDDDDVVRGASTWLTAAGYAAASANSGLQALSLAQCNPPDAIVLDVRMPKKTGLQTLSELKQDTRTQRIPVVMLSASLVDQQRALDAGARFFLTKPYNGKKLVQAVRAALDDPTTMRSNHECDERTTTAIGR